MYALKVYLEPRVGAWRQNLACFIQHNWDDQNPKDMAQQSRFLLLSQVMCHVGVCRSQIRQHLKPLWLLRTMDYYSYLPSWASFFVPSVDVQYGHSAASFHPKNRVHPYFSYASVPGTWNGPSSPGYLESTLSCKSNPNSVLSYGAC